MTWDPNSGSGAFMAGVLTLSLTLTMATMRLLLRWVDVSFMREEIAGFIDPDQRRLLDRNPAR